MIVCSCAVVSDRDIEEALIDLMNQPEAPIPTPGVVYRHLQKRMACCGCAPLAVETIYAKLEELEKKGLIEPYLGLSTRENLMRLTFFKRPTAPKPLKPAKQICEA